MAFSCGKLDDVLSTHQAELMALRLDLYLVVIECDGFNVVNDVNSYSFDSTFGSLGEDVVNLLHFVGGGNCCHMS